MQLATAILLTLGLIASPIGCLIQPCDISQAPHDCCPRTSAFAACPYDILSSAKTAPPQLAVAVIATVEFPAPPQSATFQTITPVLTDQSGLHLQNRVLRI
jgi:hypothetical protein